MWRKLECKCIKKISTGIWNEAEKPDALSLSLCKARRKCPKRHQMAPVVWRPVCLFRLLCNKMDTLRLTKYAFQPFNFLFFLFPVFRQQVLVPLIVKKKNLFWKPRAGEEVRGSLFGSSFKIQAVMMSDALQAISSWAMVFSQGFLFITSFLAHGKESSRAELYRVLCSSLFLGRRGTVWCCSARAELLSPFLLSAFSF